VVSYIESSAGVAAGGRTGLTAVVVGLLFLAAMLVAPLASAIPAAATAPALIVVGAMMMTPLADIEWKTPAIALPAFLTFALIPLTYSIANGLAVGVIAFTLLRLASGRLKSSDWMLGALAALFALRFAFLAAA
jgi:AGZA family xanthine/uracil permease-like MFS transporter